MITPPADDATSPTSPPAASADTKTHRAARLSYLPGLDGLRAIAVAAVLLYHAEVPWMSGGFLGVEVFFVLSGYLITSLLLSDWNRKGRIDLKAFWLRRARRLLPALFLLLAAVLTFAVLFLPGEVASLRTDFLAAMGYVTNWYLVFTQKSYFEMVGRPPMLQHLWSLAVEEQFYLLWPLLFVAGMTWLGSRGKMLVAALSGAAISVALMAVLYQPDADPSRIYYGTDTRASALLVGCALAFAWSRLRVPAPSSTKRPPNRIVGVVLDISGLVALASLGCLFVTLDESQPFLYTGGLALTALATAACVGTVAHPATRVFPRLLGLPPLRWLGLRSYGVYLWHWPIIALTRPGLDISLDGVPLLLLRIAATLGIAELSYRLVETPIRSGALSRTWHAHRSGSPEQRRRTARRWSGALVATLVFALALGNAVVRATPPPPPAYLQIADVTDDPQASAQPDLPIPTAPPALAQALPAIQPSPTRPVEAATEPPTASPVAQLAPPTDTAQPEPPTATAPPPPTATPVPPRATNTRPPAPPSPTRKPTKTRPATPTRTQVPEATATSEPASSPTQEPAETAIAQATPGDTIDPGSDQLSGASVLAPDPPDPTQTAQATQQVQQTQQAQQVPTAPSTPGAVNTSSHTGQVTAIGDSVMLGAVNDLRRAFSNINIDAVKGRQLSQGITVLKSLLAGGKLGDVVVIHLGSNGTFSAKQFDDIMRVLGDTRRVLFLNDKVPRRWESTNNSVIAAGVERYPNTALVDWHTASVSSSGLLYTDGTHLRATGSRVYTNLIVDAVGP